MENAKRPASRSPDAAVVLREFSAGMIHSTANVLGSLLMNAELGRMYVARGNLERAAVPLDRLMEDCDRANRMIADLQHFVSALAPVTADVVVLHEMIAAAIAEARGSVTGEDNARVELDLQEPNVRISRALQTIVCQLMQNALEAGARAIRLETASRAEELVMHILDDGHGIDADAQAKLFMPFFTTRRAQGHTGLGLCGAAYAVSALGGRISIAPRQPRGVVVEIALPQPA